MSAKLIAVANMKGGVGKTTTVVSLAETLAAQGASVLVVDLDAQANASVCLVGDEALTAMIAKGQTLDNYISTRLLAERPLAIESVVRREAGAASQGGQRLAVGLLASGAYLRVVERELIHHLAKSGESLIALDDRLRALLADALIKRDLGFDYIVFDCAPGISPVTEAALRVSDLVIAPTVADYMSTYGLQAFHHEIWTRRAGGAPPPKKKPHVLVTRFQPDRDEQRDVCLDLEADAADPHAWFALLTTRVPDSRDLALAITRAEALPFTKKYTKALIGRVLVPLAAEVEGLL